jgi:putative intracellular protease/amidase
MTTTKTVHMAVYDTLADWEVGHATAHINNGNWHKEPGRYQVRTVGETREPITTMGGVRIVPDVTLDEIGPGDSAMLILPGADTWLAGGNAAFATAARRFLEAGTPVAAICGATAGLAVEGLLDDRRHTSNAKEFLQAFGYGGADHYVDEPAVTDGDLITATATRPVDFAVEVFARLGIYEPSVLASWTKLYRDNDPAGFYELMAVGAEQEAARA